MRLRMVRMEYSGRERFSFSVLAKLCIARAFQAGISVLLLNPRMLNILIGPNQLNKDMVDNRSRC